MQIKDFDFYKDLLKKESGLVITTDKSYLIDSRLTPVIKKWNYPSIDAMTLSLRAYPDPKLIKDIVEAMTTNETSFFRDTRPFDLFRDVVAPELIDSLKNTKKLRIWCAACSTGQEPYSLAMLLREEPLASKFKGFIIDILATDICEEVLQQAREGIYSQFEVQRGLPIQLLMKNFEQDGERWRVKNDLKANIRFQLFNLLNSMDALGKFDVIFCRNVLIYFDEETKRNILNKMARRLSPEGFLFLGGAETVLGITDAFKLKEGARGVYVLNPQSSLSHKDSATSLAAGANSG